ncbi:UTRA domain-containing protein [Desulfofundulus thermobenzoicus]|uniref:UTRA domain-containing protein n=1 Tax=Desulfofundulus thermobenzoicus TaxID=29376 RepID=A0A6N7IUD4_9FIRM|nr:GntR family transcriptional regulator [Desulfofundulus thermobenzoicus]MQL53680.1 UTRA domain-containing protein [Desulfofundulus thermobenzoicus]
MGLDTNSPIPLHIQLKEILLKEIRSGIYTEKIPSEKELMNRFSVSRTTVREAVSALVNEGILKKIHGKGTFITFRPVNEWLGSIKSLTTTIKNMGMKPGIKLISHGIKSEPEIAEILGLKEYYLIERLRFADDHPIALERTYYPVEIGRKLATYDLNQIILYDVLESIGVIFYEAEQKITVSMPTPNDAKLLGINPSSSILFIERLTYDNRGNKVEYYNGIYRADRYTFMIKLSKKR